METTLAILVLVILLAVLIGLGYSYLRINGGDVRSWLVTPASLRHTVASLMGDTTTDPDRSEHAPVDAGEAHPPREPGTVTLAYDDTALATLENELRSDLGEHRERQQAIDSRMQRIEVAISEIRTIPDDLGNTMRLRDRRMRRQLDQLRHELEGVRRSATAAGARRDQAYAELYGYLAQIQASLGSALNPMFLPGEPLVLPAELSPVSLEAESWDDVGEHALQFGKAFNQSRLVLDRDTAEEIEAFLSTLRQAMTGAVYPTVRRASPTRSQLVLMRNGLESVIEALAPVRRRLEESYGQSGPPATDDDDDSLDEEDL